MTWELDEGGARTRGACREEAQLASLGVLGKVSGKNKPGAKLSECTALCTTRFPASSGYYSEILTHGTLPGKDS